MKINIDGYKKLFYLENLLRDYCFKYTKIEDLDDNLRKKFEETAHINGDDIASYKVLLKYSHLGQLYDFIRSKKIQKIKPNKINQVEISVLISKRNDIMHSRQLDFAEDSYIEEKCTAIINNLEDINLKNKWQKFLAEDIKEYRIPLLYLVYPIGKNFDYLVGREKELMSLKREVKFPTPVSIVGHGGLGKTALVLQLIEDYMYDSETPFENIYFMSFKDSVFENGTIRRFEKSISDHNDLIFRLATCMDIKVDENNKEIVSEKVWEKMFSQKSLLILDNLETEVVKSNLKEFTDIAQRFITEFMKPSRLIITSRYGLGDREAKLPLNQFQLETTKELIENYLSDELLQEKQITKKDWEWIQKYTKGNPGLIIAFCNTLKSSRKKVGDLRLEYNTQYTEESRDLYNQFEEFIVFCFENTIESMSKESQIFLSTICYLCSETNLTQINERFLTYLKDELGFNRLGEGNLRSSLLTNIGFLQPIPSSDQFYVNELFINYLDGSYSDKIFNVFSLKKSEWYSALDELNQHINQIQFTDEVSIEKLLSELYLSKYKVKKDNTFLIKAYFCDPDIDLLIKIYKNFEDELDIYKSMEFLEIIEPQLKNTQYVLKQNHLLNIILRALLEINNGILKGKINRIRQNDLKKFYRELENLFLILNNNSLSVENARNACRILTIFKDYNKVEQITRGKSELVDLLFRAYSKQVGDYSGKPSEKDKNKCLEYIDKCKSILKNNFDEVSRTSKAQFYIYCARYYKYSNPNEAIKILEGFEEFYISSDYRTAIFYLECLLIRIECQININAETRIIENLINRYKKLFTEHGANMFKEKRIRSEEQLQKLISKYERMVTK